MTKRVSKRDLAVIHEALDAGIVLEKATPAGATRRFTKGQITNQIDRGAVRTTHLSSNLRGYVWLPAEAIAALAVQAREKLARKDELLAEQARTVGAFFTA